MDRLLDLDWVHIGYAIALGLLGFFIAKRLSLIVGHAMSKRFSKHQVMLVRRLVFYGLLILFLISALQQVGFKMTVLLGAAGVFTVALSFASQTAASNLVSGIFLLFEHPFKVGDVIKVKGITGTVDAIDLLSTKLKTSDNMLVRIPNEVIMKSDILNMSYFKTRRIDILIGVGYESDMNHVKAVLLNLAHDQKNILKDPAPQVIINQFADSAIELKVMVWTATSQASSLTNHLKEFIKQRFDEEGIDIPFPQITIHQRMS